MKRIYYLYLCLVIAGACIVASSCTKYDDYTYIGPGQEQKNGILSVKEAKEFFEKTIANSRGNNDDFQANNLTPGFFTPNWGSAKICQDNNKVSVNVNIQSNYFYRANTVEFHNNKVRAYSVPIVQKLIVVRSLTGKGTDCFIMNIIPTRSCFAKFNNRLDEMFYNSEPNEDFSGTVIYSWIPNNYAVIRVDSYINGRKVESQSVFDSSRTTREASLDMIEWITGRLEIFRMFNNNSRCEGYWGEDMSGERFCVNLGDECTACNCTVCGDDCECENKNECNSDPECDCIICDYCQCSKADQCKEGNDGCGCARCADCKCRNYSDCEPENCSCGKCNKCSCPNDGACQGNCECSKCGSSCACTSQGACEESSKCSACRCNCGQGSSCPGGSRCEHIMDGIEVEAEAPGGGFGGIIGGGGGSPSVDPGEDGGGGNLPPSPACGCGSQCGCGKGTNCECNTRPSPEPETTPTLTLTLNKSQTELGNEISVSVRSTPATIESVTIQTQNTKYYSGQWNPVSSDKNYIFTATNPGKWLFRAMGTYNGKVIYSDVMELKILYPTFNEIVSNIKDDMDEAWELSLQFADGDNNGLKEFGFWVYGYGNGVIAAGRMDSGDLFPYDHERGSITLWGDNENVKNDPGASDGKFAVAIFHTHPPLHKSSYVTQRIPGASSEDDSGDFVGIVYDYDTDLVVGGIDYSDYSPKAYHYGPNRRIIPE